MVFLFMLLSLSNRVLNLAEVLLTLTGLFYVAQASLKYAVLLLNPQSIGVCCFRNSVLVCDRARMNAVWHEGKSRCFSISLSDFL